MGFMDYKHACMNVSEQSDIKDTEVFEEMCIFIEASNLSPEDRQALIESPEFLALESKGLIGKRTIVKLKASDDLERRETMAAFQLAKEAGDSLWDKLAFNRVKERELIGKIRQKYGSRAARSAKSGQKDYIKRIRSGQFVKKNDIDNRT